MNTTPRSRLSGPARSFHPFGRGSFMLLSALLLHLPVPSLAAPGDLDPSFDGDGRVLTDFGNFEEANALVVQPDGKVVAAGDTVSFANANLESDIVLARYNRDGSLDTSFGDGGRVVTDFGGLDRAEALVVQQDGKVVAAGTTNGFSSDSILARYNRDGSLDPSFGVGGRVVVTEACCANTLVLQPDGKLVLGASSLVRLNPDGTLDTSFGGDGFALHGSVSLFKQELALQPDGKLVTAGSTSVDTSGDNVVDQEHIALQRFNPDGSPDTSFGSGSHVDTDFGEDSAAEALVLQPDGKLVAAGAIGTILVDQDFLLARYHADGSLDTSFGNGGLARTDFGNSFRGARALVRQADGKLVASGSALARYTTPTGASIQASAPVASY